MIDCAPVVAGVIALVLLVGDVVAEPLFIVVSGIADVLDVPDAIGVPEFIGAIAPVLPVPLVDIESLLDIIMPLPLFFIAPSPVDLYAVT